MIKMKSLHHVSLAITDVEQSKQFYKEKLGFLEIERPPFDFPGLWFQIGNQQLHLIEYDLAKTLRHSGKIDTRDGHLAIRVASYSEAVQHLTDNQIAFLEKPNSKSGFKQIFVSDPDGNIIEFNVEQKQP
ncbi:VOC family protein [Alkalihalobacillus sp. LMS39]|uniref:VOC family protein n=1 Tax=Alkalihalobacillus sp. LMS39 TaxID=2924032 RepID=UPI001FB1A465|nr:VOC family protein [Alkalihalobacillus sp. LMS39]UOE96205.1 VOC family protein [Alkalihalobacillus sp. LMS39]